MFLIHYIFISVRALTLKLRTDALSALKSRLVTFFPDGKQTGNGLEQRGFSCAVSPEKGNNFVVGHLHINSPEDPEFAVARLNSLQKKHAILQATQGNSTEITISAFNWPTRNSVLSVLHAYAAQAMRLTNFPCDVPP